MTARAFEGGPPELAGRPHEAASNGSPRWMAACRRERVHRTRARLVNLARGGLRSVSGCAYKEGITGLAPDGPLDPAPDLPRLVQVHFQDLT